MRQPNPWSNALKQPCLDRLRALGGRATLREAVAEICGPVAALSKIDLIADGAGGYFCQVELAAPDQRFALMREVGGFGFGDGVCFIIPRTWKEQP